MRVHELAKELGCNSKDIMAKLHDVGVEAKSHMSTIDETAASLLREESAKAPSVEQKEKVEVTPESSAKKTPAKKTPAEKTPAEKTPAEKTPAEKKETESGLSTMAAVPAQVDDEPEVVVEDKVVKVKGSVVVKDLAEALGMRPNQLIAELMGMNILASINQRVDVNIIRKLVEKHGFTLDYEKKLAEHQQVVRRKKFFEDEEEEDNSEDMMPRPPVVTFLGHVDHGKTSLLDRIRDTAVVKGESGGITQHIGAYTVDIDGRKITFLDTPGHAAFTAMRARGANLTDVAVIIIAADDGIMPQTKEAIMHAKAATGVTMMIAINKTDLPAANVENVMQQLQAEDLTPEDWGGDVITVPVSAQTGDGVDHLLDMILLQAEMKELKGNPSRRASGYVIEAQLEPGRGPTANVLVTNGTLKVGDVVLCEKYWGRVRALMNDHGVKVKSASPATPVKCLGLSGVPEAGAEFNVITSDKTARFLADELALNEKGDQVSSSKKTSLDDLFNQIEDDKKLELKVILKADTQGSIEAIATSLYEIKSDKVFLDIILSATGNMTINDVMLASASSAVILGFHVAKEPGVAATAKHEGVDIRMHQVIYELIDEVRDGMTGLLAPELKENVVGHADIKQVFPMGKRNKVAGCYISDGFVNPKVRVRVLREGEVLFEGKIDSLKRFQDEVSEVKAGLECGIRIVNFFEMEEGDKFEFYNVEELKQTL